MPSDPNRLRRLAAGGCLIAAPVLYVAGVIADPALRLGEAGENVGVYGQNLEQVSLSAAVLHWSWVLLVPGIVGMIHLVRRRAVVLGHVAGALALLGVVNFSALMLGDFFYARLEHDLPPATGAALADRAMADPGAAFGFQIPGFAGLAGLLLLGLVLAYARQVPWWAPFAMLAGVFTAPVFWVGTLIGGLLYLAGSGVIGLRMIRMSDAEWSGTPG
ncbi:hypothetical protein HNP84_002100 [Thermocatellispora tengchongensis]|uniref:DUF4386 domain-containing protein n=1 Tax=Thermocatellispora tengchongensis TaxID=1073253 RepID=A0A840NUG2_9ACTN|nr:hypothetical protein [Thermocatellispora tengchongensis]MBB5132384.1 hypothetical protein [Thermocatellispora tengchongensis]